METQFTRTETLLGNEALMKLSNSRVAVFGIGGVGGYTVEALARSGVGELDLIDNDIVNLTNLNRQIIALHSTLGKHKVDVAKERILDINPNIKVNIYKTFFTPETSGQFDFSKYGTYFEKLNALVSALRGEEKAPQIFKPITTYEETLSGCTKDEKSSQTKYTAITDNSTACVSFTFTATESAEYYFYTPTNNPKECKIDVNGVGLGTYLGSDTRHIFSLGWYESGQTVNVRITLMEDPLTIINYYDYIWYLDKEVFEDCFADLADNPQLIIDEGYTDDHLTGSIMTTEKNTKVMTTIPYDEGWKVFIDGEEIEIYKTLDALIAFDVEEEGEHSVELKYMPNIYVLGMTVTIFGIVLFIAICSADFVLKKTLLKNKTVPKVSTYWVLEDFDEDFSQFSEFEDEEVVPKKKMTDKVTEIFGRLKNKNNKKDNGDN